MKVCVVAPSPVPFVHGGAERFWSELVQAINEHTDHEAELVKLLVDERGLVPLMDAYEAFSRLDLSHFGMVISGKYPAWMVEHPNHVIYLLHPLRGLYDTYPRGWPTACDAPAAAELVELLSRPPTRANLPRLFGAFRELVSERGPNDPLVAHPGPLARQLVHHLDAVGCSSSAIARYYALSATVAARAGCLPDEVEPVVLHPPPPQRARATGAFEHVLAFSRVDGPKRMDLLVEAMRFVPADLVLKVAGDGPQLGRLRALASGNRNVELLGRVSDDELTALLVDALAVPFVPLDEDYGFVTVEAFQAGKPVVTCHDSGGPTELVVDGENGFVVEAEPAAIGRALTMLAADRDLARRMGAAGQQSVAGLDWGSFARQLVCASRPRRMPRRAPADPPPPSVPQAVASKQPAWRAGFPRLVIASTFAVHGNPGGGPVRCEALARALSRSFDVHIVSLGAFGRAGGTSQWAPGIVETVLPVSAETQARDEALARAAGMPITDIIAADLAGPAFERELGRALAAAAVVVLAHPYMHPLVEKLAPTMPVVYDAHNAEFVLKAEILRGSPHFDHLIARVTEIEAAAARDAVLVATCAPDDRAALEEKYGIARGRFVDVPNGCDVTSIPFVTGAARNEAGRRWLQHLRSLGHEGDWSSIAVFLGSWHRPNNLGARTLCEQAWLTPDVLHVLAGTHTESLYDMLVPKNVLLAGVLPAAAKRGLLAAATIGLNPVGAGSGTNLKMLDYFAAGLPVLSTPTGTRGFPVTDRRELVVSDLDDFPDVLRNLPALQPVLDGAAAAARTLVEREYDWAVVGERLRVAVTDALLRSPAAAHG